MGWHHCKLRLLPVKQSGQKAYTRSKIKDSGWYQFQNTAEEVQGEKTVCMAEKAKTKL